MCVCLSMCVCVCVSVCAHSRMGVYIGVYVSAYMIAGNRNEMSNTKTIAIGVTYSDVATLQVSGLCALVITLIIVGHVISQRSAMTQRMFVLMCLAALCNGMTGFVVGFFLTNGAFDILFDARHCKGALICGVSFIFAGMFYVS